MAFSRGSSPLPAVGALAGMMLLGFAGFIVLKPAVSLKSTGPFMARRLQSFGYITTSIAPSSFDSSDSSFSGSSLEPSKSFVSGSFESLESGEMWADFVHHLGHTMGALTVSLTLQTIFACVYYTKITQQIISNTGTLDDSQGFYSSPIGEGNSGDFGNRITEFWKQPYSALLTLCCPMVRLAHTNAVSNVCPFWETLWCYCCCAWMTVNIGPSCLLVWWRLRLKAIMKVEENFFVDFIVTFFCPCFSLCQMANAADDALGVQVAPSTNLLSCCQSYRWKAGAHDGGYPGEPLTYDGK